MSMKQELLHRLKADDIALSLHLLVISIIWISWKAFARPLMNSHKTGTVGLWQKCHVSGCSTDGPLDNTL